MNSGPLSYLCAASVAMLPPDQLEHLVKFADPLHLGTLVLIALSLAVLRRRGKTRITETEKELSRCCDRYRGLLESVGNALFIFNADSGVLEESNAAAQELLGFSGDEMTLLRGREVFPEGEQEKFRSLVYRLRRRGSADPIALTFQRKDGSLFLGEVEARLLSLESERLVAGIVRDISEKRRAQGELTQRNRQLSILNTLLTRLNQGEALDTVLEGTLAELMDLFQAGGGAIYLMEEKGNPAVTVALQVSAEYTRELGGCIARMRECRSVTICDRKGMDRSCPVCNSEAHGWLALCAVSLTSHNRLIGVMHLLHQESRPYGEEEVRFLTTVGRQMGNALEHARLFAELDAKSAELLRSHQLLEKSSRSLAHSELKLKRNLALVEQANADLKRLSSLKNHFLGLVSHEFNTPLTSIISGTDHLLQQQLAAPEDAQVLEMVRDGGLRLKDLVGDLLKLIRLEAKEEELNRAPVHLKTQLELVKGHLEPVLALRRQTLVLHRLEELPFFEGDWNYLRRIFNELIENASKFTPDGGEITISGRVVEGQALLERRETLERFNEGFLARSRNRCYLEVEVRDNGIGIPREEEERIFQIFYEVGDIRHHSSGRNKFQGKGAGLGLALVKGMVEAHGGMIWVESGSGSSFFLLLPLEPEATQPELF